MKTALITATAVSVVLAGCNLAPAYVQPDAAVPAAFPTGPAYSPMSDAAVQASWKALLTDARLRTVIDRALSESRSLRQSLAQVEAARALYRGQQSAVLPTVSAGLTSTFTGGDAADTESHQAYISLSSFEIDLFGRLRNETASAFETYLASDAGARSARVALVAETANAWLTLAADQDLLRLAEDTAASAQQSLTVTETLFSRQLVSRLDVASARQVLEQANGDIADYTAQVVQDRNALALLVGAPIEDALLPPSLKDLDDAVGLPSPGLSSDVLLQRPDVLQAEHQLRAANADIGAARAAMFPSLSLTASTGLVSTALSRLFSDGQDTWSASPSVSAPIFTPGARANVAYSRAQQQAAVAAYQLAVQTAFRETADALARAGTIGAQRRAQQAQADASADTLTLTTARYRAGIDDSLARLTAQRNDYAAQQGVIAVLLQDLTNRIALYQALGGSNADWTEAE